MTSSDRTQRPHGLRGKWLALALALAVNIVFIGVLVFSVSWQNRRPEAVTAELYAPPTRTPAPVIPPKPQPEPPPPEPKVAPKPPEPKVEQPDPRAADIALRAEKERKAREVELERERLRRQAELDKEKERREAEIKKAEDQKRLVERQQRDLAEMRAQADRETRQRVQAQREQQLQAQAESEAKDRAKQAQVAARNRAQTEWIDRVRAKIRGNVILPPELPGNPEAVFEVIQLPSGEIIDVQLRKSSGVRAYDDAVQRAILKSSPLPKGEVYERALSLRFRPSD